MDSAQLCGLASNFGFQVKMMINISVVCNELDVMLMELANIVDM